jgi:hypothetical protein
MKMIMHNRYEDLEEEVHRHETVIHPPPLKGKKTKGAQPLI